MENYLVFILLGLGYSIFILYLLNLLRKRDIERLKENFDRELEYLKRDLERDLEWVRRDVTESQRVKTNKNT